MENPMIEMNEGQSGLISEPMIAAGQNYLGTCGALDEPSLIFSEVFAVHFLESVLDECEEAHGWLGGEEAARAVEFFSRHFDPGAPISITYPDFVKGLLAYALLGVDLNLVDEQDRDRVFVLPLAR